MKFAYREYVAQFPGADDFRLILRPVITIRIAGPQAAARWDALVDTGADETLLPLSLSQLLGVDLDGRPTSQAAGISGDKLMIYYGEVSLQISSENETIEWRDMVGFVDFQDVDDEVIVLGHGACLDYFTAIFDGERGELTLQANGLLPQSDQP